MFEVFWYLAVLPSSGDCHCTDRFLELQYFDISDGFWDQTQDILNTSLIC